MSRRINMMIDDDNWELLSRVPSGERSRALNEALREWLTLRQRERAASDLARIRRGAPRVATDELVRWVREDREDPAR